MNGNRITGALLGLGIFAFGLGISLHYGRQGLNPLDSCIVFDGAWREVCGQRVFVDYTAPNGFVPIAIQSLFFRVFGVNWWVYCLHAAIFNGLFALLVLGILRLAGAPRWLAAGYALLSAVVFYPPMGVPYMDQHAFFFMLLGVWMGMKASMMGERARFWMWMALPAVWMLTILSKQSPGFFAVPVSLLVLAFWVPMQDWKRVAMALLLGLVPAFLCFLIFVGWPGTVWDAFWESFWTRPQALGKERLAGWQYGTFKTIRTMAWYPFQTLSQHNFVHRHFLYLPLLLVPVEWALRRWMKKPRGTWPRLRLLVLGIGMTLVCSFFMHLTMNQPQNGLPLVLIVIGLGHVYYREWLKGFEFAARLKRFPAILTGASLLLLGYAGLATADFHQKVNVTRLVLDFTPGFPYMENPPFRGDMGFLDYQAPYHYSILKPWELIDWMKENEGKCLLFGDLTLVYGLSGKPSASPFLWIHEGLTMPKTNSPDFQKADARLLASANAHNVRYVIFEHPSHITWLQLPLEVFQQTHLALSARKEREFSVGGFIIWELRP